MELGWTNQDRCIAAMRYTSAQGWVYRVSGHNAMNLVLKQRVVQEVGNIENKLAASGTHH